MEVLQHCTAWVHFLEWFPRQLPRLLEALQLCLSSISTGDDTPLRETVSVVGFIEVSPKSVVGLGFINVGTSGFRAGFKMFKVFFGFRVVF